MGKKEFAENTYTAGGFQLHYYEVENNCPPLVMLHAQGVCGLSYDNVISELSRYYHVYAVDCFGHGGSSHRKEDYNLKAMGEAVLGFIKDRVGGRVHLTGHSSGGLIAAYIAAYSDLCEELYLEDPPLFSSQGDRRLESFNYIDLSTVCHQFVNQSEYQDFVLYYFEHQKMWDFFPEKSRDQLKCKLVKMAKSYRTKHPDRDLKVPFWPKKALSGFRGMNHYDPWFGEAFYNDSFHAGIKHDEMLSNINCKTIIMKAKTNFNRERILLAAMSDEDAVRANQLIKNSRLIPFDCGHGIHIEKKQAFLKCFKQNL